MKLLNILVQNYSETFVKSHFKKLYSITSLYKVLVTCQWHWEVFQHGPDMQFKTWSLELKFVLNKCLDFHKKRGETLGLQILHA